MKSLITLLVLVGVSFAGIECDFSMKTALEDGKKISYYLKIKDLPNLCFVASTTTRHIVTVLSTCDLSKKQIKNWENMLNINADLNTACKSMRK